MIRHIHTLKSIFSRHSHKAEYTSKTHQFNIVNIEYITCMLKTRGSIFLYGFYVKERFQNLECAWYLLTIMYSQTNMKVWKPFPCCLNARNIWLFPVSLPVVFQKIVTDIILLTIAGMKRRSYGSLIFSFVSTDSCWKTTEIISVRLEFTFLTTCLSSSRMNVGKRLCTLNLFYRKSVTNCNNRSIYC